MSRNTRSSSSSMPMAWRATASPTRTPMRNSWRCATARWSRHRPSSTVLRSTSSGSASRRNSRNQFLCTNALGGGQVAFPLATCDADARARSLLAEIHLLKTGTDRLEVLAQRRAIRCLEIFLRRTGAVAKQVARCVADVVRRAKSNGVDFDAGVLRIRAGRRQPVFMFESAVDADVLPSRFCAT